MKSKLYSIVILLFIVVVSQADQHIDFIANPNCTEGCWNPWLIYGHRQSKDEGVHYVYGASDKPTFMMMSGTVDSFLSINWTAIQDREAKSVKISGIQTIFGLSLQNIILFNDINDTGTINNIPSNQKVIIPMSDFQWNFNVPETSNSMEYPVYFSSNIYRGKELPNNSGFSLNLTSYIKDGRAQSLPHLLVSPDSTLLEISLIDLVTALNESSLAPLISNFTHTRLALDVMIFGLIDASSYSFLSFKSLDDEHTPGIFSIDEIVSRTDTRKDSGYMQWRPVAYLTKDRNINFATRPNLNKTLNPVDHSHLNGSRDSLIYYMLGNDTSDFSATQTIITFGRPKDGFYAAYNYTLWAFTFGLGNPPREGFSASVIVIISIGIGVPIVLLGFAILYWILSRRLRL